MHAGPRVVPISLDQIPAKGVGLEMAEFTGKNVGLTEDDRHLVQERVSRFESIDYLHANWVDSRGSAHARPRVAPGPPLAISRPLLKLWAPPR